MTVAGTLRKPKGKNFSRKSYLLLRTGGKLPAIDWTIQVQPIGNSQLGIVIYNASGKTMHAGTIAYDENKSAIRLNALYPNVTNVCKQTFEATVTHTSDDGNPTVAGKVTMSYEV